MIKKERHIVVLTDPGETLKQNIGYQSKLIDIFDGNFREIRVFFDDIRRKNRTTYLYLSMPNNQFLDAEKKYDSYDKKSELLSLESIVEKLKPYALIVNLKYENFKKFYETRLKHILPDLNSEIVIFIGSANIHRSLRKDGLWFSNFLFFKRSGVSRIGLENQKKIKRSLNI